VLLAGCGGGSSAPAATPTASSTVTATPTTAATASPTPTMTPSPLTGPQIGFMGVLRSDDTLLEPEGVDAAGRSIFTRAIGNGFVLVIDAKPGINRAAVGRTAFASDPEDPSVRPSLQIEATRDLGDGSPAVCDNAAPQMGGVPGIDPPSFADTQQISDALNDLGCRFNDGTGVPGGRQGADACVMFPDGEYSFVDPSATVEFCAFISQTLRFPSGDTIVTARIRDESGAVGPEQQIVIRVGGS
jgi:hypothetical protein